MRDGAKTKRLARTEVPAAEHIASAVILGLMVCLAAFLIWKGGHYDPSLYALDAEALPKNVEEPRAIHAEDTPLLQAGRIPLDLNLAGLAPLGPTEFYDADTLYEKINGRAPAYLGFAFQELRARSFSVGGGDAFVDVFAFRMDTPMNAFGVFSLERDPEGAALDFAPDGYADDLGFHFRQGNVYVQVIASDTAPSTLRQADAAARAMAQALPADDRGLGARHRLPPEGLVADTIEYKKSNAMGQAFLRDIFMAEYDTDAGRQRFFIMVGSSAEVTDAWEQFLAFSGRYGEVEEPFEIAGARVFRAESFGTWRVVYVRDDELGGVTGAEDPAAALIFLRSYLEPAPAGEAD